MPLKGEQKKLYQREYMRKKRTGLTTGSNEGLTGKTAFGTASTAIFETNSIVPGVGLEPTRIAPADFKSAASADSATPAKLS